MRITTNTNGKRILFAFFSILPLLLVFFIEIVLGQMESFIFSLGFVYLLLIYLPILIYSSKLFVFDTDVYLESKKILLKNTLRADIEVNQRINEIETLGLITLSAGVYKIIVNNQSYFIHYYEPLRNNNILNVKDMKINLLNILNRELG
jgi:hypothetical protein